MLVRDLTPLEARVLAVLVEKQHTVPDSYPLSLNALTSGCNQKTARDPVMSADESDVLAALNALKDLSLVFEVSGSRVTRFEHNLKRVYGVPGQAEALLTILMLRGPQTAAELRLNSERLHRFADVSSVEGFLEELAEREPPLARKLPRAPGARESRWASLLCGPVQVPEGGVLTGAASGQDEEIARLRAEVELLKTQLARVMRELGMDAGAVE
ncbi:YceH family protein [Inhella gelatinilytica]|uniref:YceH family protein n=1 Tax=Inhella gelatinilytica TaxID=2795030 RepID=A0A931IVA0_9BURK|nr:YceH family protein [Inhella gelatinilytica]MBH9552804.1 YceH family protein [Inhella gelatinilytica]